MNVVVQMFSGEQINPVYSPEHLESVSKFYADLYKQGQCDGYTITLDDGSLYKAEGFVL